MRSSAVRPLKTIAAKLQSSKIKSTETELAEMNFGEMVISAVQSEIKHNWKKIREIIITVQSVVQSIIVIFGILRQYGVYLNLLHRVVSSS